MAKVVADHSGSAFQSVASNGLNALLSGEAPAFPLTTVPVVNQTGLSQTVVVTGGSLSAVSVNGVSAGTGGTYTVPSRQAIVLTYTGSPSWAWTAPVVTTVAKNADGSAVKDPWK